MLGENARRNVQEHSGQDSIASSCFEPLPSHSKLTAMMGKIYLEKFKMTLLSQKQGKYNIEPNTEEKYKMISRTELRACWAQVVELGVDGLCDP